jgi:UDP-N-acetylmuramate--alanine ligase
MVLIVDIYPSRETDTLGIHARHLVDAMRHPRALYAGNLVQATEYLRQALRPEDVVITLGAGNVNRILADLKSDSQIGRPADNPISPGPM